MFSKLFIIIILSFIVIFEWMGEKDQGDFLFINIASQRILHNTDHTTTIIISIDILIGKHDEH